MTDHEIDIVIAEAIGEFKDCHVRVGRTPDEYGVVGRAACGDGTYTVRYYPVPKFSSDLNVIYCAEKQKGLHGHPKDFALAANWTTALRAAVAHRCPVNKVGATLVSDADMMSASARERAEAFVQTFKLQKR